MWAIIIRQQPLNSRNRWSLATMCTFRLQMPIVRRICRVRNLRKEPSIVLPREALSHSCSAYSESSSPRKTPQVIPQVRPQIANNNSNSSCSKCKSQTVLRQSGNHHYWVRTRRHPPGSLFIPKREVRDNWATSKEGVHRSHRVTSQRSRAF